MLQSFGRLLRAEWRLYQHNKVNKLGVVDRNAQTIHVVPDVFTDSMLKELLADLGRLKSSWIRGNNEWRRGFAIGGHELRENIKGDWLDYLNSSEFKSKVQNATGIPSLEYVSVKDTNRISLLLYKGVDGGDGIDWHVDGSIYLGERWAGIITLVEKTGEDSAKLELEKNDSVIPLSKRELTAISGGSDVFFLRVLRSFFEFIV